MPFSRWVGVVTGVAVGAGVLALADQQPPPQAPADDPVRVLVGRLELEKYKATIKGLTQFGDRRQGTKRNRDAVDWIEAQLKSYGCTNTERIIYQHPAARRGRSGRAARRRGRRPGGQRAGGQGGGAAQAGGGAGQAAAGAGQAAGAAGQGGGRQGGGGGGGRGQTLGPLAEPVRNSSGGSTLYGNRGRTGVYNPDSANAAPLDPRLRALNEEPTTPGERQEVYCTKIGTTRPDEMYILGAHMDGHGWGEAANDDGSGTALVMELARIFSSPERADRAFDSLRALEQRGNRTERRLRRTSTSGRTCRASRIRKGRAAIRSRSGSA